MHPIPERMGSARALTSGLRNWATRTKTKTVSPPPNGTKTKIIRSLDFEIYEHSHYKVSTAPNGFQKVIDNSREECWDPSRK